MKIIDYVFENLDLLKSIFNQKAYKRLVSLKAKNSFDEFKEIFELIISDEVLEKIKNIKDKNLLTPISENSFFMARELELKRLKELFEDKQIVVVYGVGGIGKTFLAKEFLNREMENFRNVGWINYADSLKSSIVRELNEKYRFKGSEEDVYQNILLELKKLDGINLIIIDSFDDIEEFKNLVEIPDNFKVLITSRAKTDEFQNFELTNFDKKTAEEFFYRFYRLEKNGIEEILRKLNYSPFLLELTAKTLQTSNLTILKLLDKKLDFNDEIRYIKDLIDIHNLDKDLFLVLKWFAILPSIEIEFNDLMEYFTVKENKIINNIRNVLFFLVKKGLIIQNNNRFKLHQKIQKTIIKYFKPTIDECKDIIYYFYNKLPQKDIDNLMDSIKYIKYITNILNIFGINDENLIRLSYYLSIFYTKIGENKNALIIQQNLLKNTERVLNKNTFQKFQPDLYDAISHSMSDLGNFKEALNFQQKAIEIYKKQQNNEGLLNSYNNISVIYQNLKNFDKALEYQKKSKDIMDQSPEKNEYYLALYYYNLSNIYRNLEKFDEALKFAKKEITISENNLDKSHPHLGNSYNNISIIYLSLNILDKAIYFANKDLNICKNIFPQTHQNIINTKNLIQAIESKISPYVKTITIKNFKLLKDIKLNLNRYINILIGENSTGKTSTLQAISLGILPERNNDDRQIGKFEEFITKGKDFTEIEIESENFRKVVKLTKEYKEVSNDEIKTFILSYGVNFFTPLEGRDYHLMIDKIFKPHFSNHYFTSPIFRKFYSEDFYDPLVLLNKLELAKYNSQFKDYKENIEKFQKDFIKNINDFIGSKIKIEEINNSYYFTGFGEKYNLEEISEGYRRYILLISDILLRIYIYGKTPNSVIGIILIDEFDNHLHPDWQNGIVDKLHQIFPHIQFILTTHNPMAILDREIDEIIRLEVKNGKVQQLENDINTKNVDIGTIFLSYFNAKSIIGNQMVKKVNRFYKLKILGKTTTDEFKKLDKELNLTSFVYDNQYFQFLKFLTKNKIDIEKSLEKDKLKSLLEEFQKEFEVSI